MDKENILYYQSNIKTSKNEDSVYAMKYASQQVLIDNLEQQCKKQKEAIDKVINLIVKETKSMPTNGCKIRLIEILDILNEVSE